MIVFGDPAPLVAQPIPSCENRDCIYLESDSSVTIFLDEGTDSVIHLIPFQGLYEYDGGFRIDNCLEKDIAKLCIPSSHLDTCAFIDSFAIDVQVVLVQNQDTMWLSIQHLGFSSYYIFIPFHKGEFEFEVADSNIECSEIIGSRILPLAYFRTFYNEDFQAYFQEADVERIAAFVKISFLQPCYQDIYPFYKASKRWDLSPPDHFWTSQSTKDE